MEKSKRINLETIEKEYNSTRKLHEGLLSNGEVIRYHAKFSENKINKLLEELHNALLEEEEKEVNFFNQDGRLFQYSYYLIIKYFTDLGREFPDTLEENISLFSKMIELGLFVEIIEILPYDEVGKVIERIVKIIQVQLQSEEINIGEFNKIIHEKM